MKYDQAVIRLSCKKDIDLFVQIHWLHSAFGFGFEVACFFDFVLFRVWFWIKVFKLYFEQIYVRFTVYMCWCHLRTYWLAEGGRYYLKMEYFILKMHFLRQQVQ